MCHTHNAMNLSLDNARISFYLKWCLLLGLLFCGFADATALVHQGQATYYHANAAAACSLGSSVDYTMTAAMGLADYNGSAMCGAYLRVMGPKGEVVVRVVDICGTCKPGDLDLNQAAFAKVADLRKGREPIRWHILSPELKTTTQYHFKENSNAWWLGVQIRNHRNPVAKLEYLKPDGEWGNVPRARYNYFVHNKLGMGIGPFTFRVTDLYGHQFVDKNIASLAGRSVKGANQFPMVNEQGITLASLTEKGAVPDTHLAAVKQAAPPEVSVVQQTPSQLPLANEREIDLASFLEKGVVPDTHLAAVKQTAPPEVNAAQQSPTQPQSQPEPVVVALTQNNDQSVAQSDEDVSLDSLVNNPTQIGVWLQDEDRAPEPPQEVQSLDQIILSQSSY